MPARQTLPDGSTVEIKEGAVFEVHYRSDLRRIILQRGEVHFQVAKDAARPFVVVAAGVEVRAIGTAFSVEIGQDAVEVLVTEGTIIVAPPLAAAGSEPPTVIAEAGNRVKIARAAATQPPIVVPLGATELADRLAWRVPRLEFSGTPLHEALALFNRHSAVQLSLAEPRLGERQLSGIVRADNTDTLLQLLESEFGLIIERRTGTEIILRSASRAGDR